MRRNSSAIADTLHLWGGSLLILASIAGATLAQPPGTNTDEAQVKPYTLPDPLVMQDGTKITDAKTWFEKRRPEILNMVQELQYGKMPGKPADFSCHEYSLDKQSLGGTAIRKEIMVQFTDRADGPRMMLLVYIPKNAKGPVPAFLGLNFQGNQAVNADSGISLGTVWTKGPDGKYTSHTAPESSRGAAAGRWQVEKVLSRGYALATACYQDIDPDFDDGFQNGVQPIFDKGVQPRPADAWGSVAAWAWGLSRALDYLETDPAIDAKRVAVLGHSRLGKTSLWAGAFDQRFALVISNDSGAGGAALHKRNFGETVKNLNTSFPHWFDGNFKQFSDKEDTMPFDQHEVIALCAPRPVLIESANADLWADPRGEFLAAKGADPVYRLLGTDGLAATDMPEISQPVLSTIGYHIRPGAHDVKLEDWLVFLAFADKHMAKK